MTAPKAPAAPAGTEVPFSAELPAAVFAAALARLAALAPERATVPIVQHALLRWTGKDSLQLAATNLDQALAVTVTATAAGGKNAGKTGGATTASAARLNAIAQLLDAAKPVTLKLAAHGLQVGQGRSTWRLPTLPAEDFPAALVEPLDGAVAWSAPAEALVAHLKEIEAAAAEDVTRPHLAGLFFDLAARDDPPRPAGSDAMPHRAALVACQTARLAAVDLAALSPPEGARGFILPTPALRPLADLAKGQATLALGLTDNGLTAAVEGVFFRTKLVDGARDYPDWRRIVPPERPLQVRLGLAAFRRALSQVAVIEGDPEAQGKGKARLTAVKLAFGAAEVEISSRNQLGEEAGAACALTWVSAPPAAPPAAPVSLTINAAHLTWAATSLRDANGGEPAEVDLAFAPEVSPLLVTRAGDTARDSLRLVMPLRR